MHIGRGKRRGESGGCDLLCWSSAEQTVSIRLCTEVTNLESRQMQAKSEPAQPVAFMPACVADSWRLDCVRDRGAKKGGFLSEKVGLLYSRHNWGAQ